MGTATEYTLRQIQAAIEGLPGVSGAPIDSEYVVTTLDASLTAESLHSGLSGADLHAPKAHTHVEADVTDLDHDAVKLQGRTLVSTAPSDGQAVVWDAGNSQWEPGSVAAGAKLNVMLNPEAAVFPASNSAVLHKVEATNFVWYEARFVESVAGYLYFKVPIPASYAQGDLKVTLFWKATAIEGDVVWSLAHYDRANGEVLDAAPTETQSVTDTAEGTANYVNTCYVTFTTHPADNDLMILRVARDAGNASDTMSGLARLLSVLIEEQ